MRVGLLVSLGLSLFLAGCPSVDTTTAPVDLDRDGATANEDCNDEDLRERPGLPEIPYDGLDNDCDPSTPDDDIDQDGFLVADDCDDTSAAVNPAATELPRNGIDDDCNPSTCPGHGFALDGIDWSLPPGEWRTTFRDASCGSRSEQVATLDVDGDGRLDLLQMSNCEAESLGTSQWRLYPGTKDGFAAKPMELSLPTRLGSWSFDVPWPGLSEPAFCGTTTLSGYETLDLDGDGWIDIVQTDNCGNDEVGRTRWLVHRGSPTGFGDGIVWDLPTRWTQGAETSAWPGFRDAGQCDGLDRRSAYALIEVSGDGIPDLAETYTCGAEEGLGTSVWRVWLGTSSGFDQTPTSWPVPERWGTADETPWVQPGEEPICGTAADRSRVRTRDLDGDGYLDLIETYACGVDDVGVDKWWVHRGTGTGFSPTATTWSIPERDVTLYGFTTFDDLSDLGRCEARESSAYGTFDFDGDGFVDLVETFECNTSGVGFDHWRVFFGSEDGFQTTHRPWTLPERWFDASDSVAQSSWIRTSGLAGCNPAATRRFSAYDILDIDADGRMDLVETDHCGKTGVGVDHWRVFRGQCEP